MNTPVPHEKLEPARRALVFACVLLGVWYLGWRAITLNPDSPLFSLALYCAEVFSFVMALLHFFGCWNLTTRRAPTPPAGMSVDVFIPSYNESVDLVRKTLLAATRMDYPHQTWLLDDGNRPEMRALCEEMGCGYLARDNNLHAKAGNLNNALAHTNGDFIAIFDADHAPHKHFLARTLGYFLNPKVAFVQTPQDFYNLDSYQHRGAQGNGQIWTEQSLFFRVIQRGKDFWNAAFFCGSCAVIRRSSLEKVGGFATGTVTEDLHTSIRIHAAGFESVYHAESLAFGIAPESISPFISQRMRWGQGAMHVWRMEGVLSKRGLTFAQRLNYFASISTYFEGWSKLLFYTAPIIVLTTGILPIKTSSLDFLIHFVPYYLASFWVFEEVARGYGRTFYVEQYNMIRFAAFAWSTLALFFPVHRFKVTPKGVLARRNLGVTLPHWLVLSGNTLAIVTGLLLYAFGRDLPENALVSNIIWALVNAGLATAVLKFTQRSTQNRRQSYRFSIPLFGQLDLADGTRVVGTIDDISEKGLRFYGAVPTRDSLGESFTGKLELPDGPLEFTGKIRSVIASPERHTNAEGLGCSIEIAAPHRSRLEYFLFGTDLQMQINGISEQIETPLSRFLPHQVVHAGRPRLAGHIWTPAHILSRHDGDKRSMFALVAESPDQSDTRLMCFTPVPENIDWNIFVFSPSRNTTLIADLELAETLETACGDIHFYRIHKHHVQVRTASANLPVEVVPAAI